MVWRLKPPKHRTRRAETSGAFSSTPYLLHHDVHIGCFHSLDCSPVLVLAALRMQPVLILAIGRTLRSLVYSFKSSKGSTRQPTCPSYKAEQFVPLCYQVFVPCASRRASEGLKFSPSRSSSVVRLKSQLGSPTTFSPRYLNITHWLSYL